MAMEVAASKQLHKHSVPVVIVALSLFVAATIAFSGDTPTVSGWGLARAFVTSSTHAEPVRSGLTHPSWQAGDYDKTMADQQPTTTPNDISQAGDSAQWSLIMQSSAPTDQ